MNCSSSLCCFQNYCIRRIVVWFVIQFIICLFTFKIISLQDSLAACLIKLFKLRDDKFFLIRSHVRRLMGIFFCTSLYAFFSFFFFSKDICASFYACISLVTTSLYFMANVSRFINFKRVCAYIDLLFSFQRNFKVYVFVLKKRIII